MSVAATSILKVPIGNLLLRFILKITLSVPKTSYVNKKKALFK